MAIGRISGQMLSANLARSGTDLTFETNLLALDVTNSRVGVGTASPATTLHVNATDAIRLPSGGDANRPGTPANGDIRYNTDGGNIEGYSGGAWTNLAGGTNLSDADADTLVAVERTADEDTIHFATGGTDAMHIRSDQSLELNNLKIADLTISSLTTNGDINITPNGTGQTVIKNLSVTDGLDLGDLNALNVGDINVDSVSSDNGTDFDIVLDDNQSTALEIKEGANAYMTFDTTNTAEVITAGQDFTVATGKTFTTDTADINGGAIDGTTIGGASAAAGTFTTATATDLQVTNLKANDGTSAGSIADSTGIVTLASSVLTTTDINGGSVDGVTIGSNSAATALVANGGINIDDDGDGAMDGVVIGANTAAAGTFTTVTLTINLDLGDQNLIKGGYIDVDSISSSDGSFDLLLDDNQANALEIKEGANAYVNFATTDGSELITFSKATTIASGVTFSSDTVDINGGAIDGTIIGANSAAAGTFTDVTATNVQATNFKANDGTAAMTITDSTGAVDISTALTATANVSIDGGEFVFNESGADLDARFEGDNDANLLFIDASADRIGIGTNTPGYSLDIGSKADAVLLPQGNTAARPTASAGIIRFNSQTGQYEGCQDGSTYVNFAIAGAAPTFTKETTTGDGSTTTFSGFFSTAPESANNVFVYIDNVYQEPTENYTVSGTTLTFTSAPHSGARIFAITGADGTALVTGGVARSETTAVNFTSSATNIMTFNGATYRSAELFVQMQDTANTEYSAMKAIVTHDGTTAYISVFGITNTGASDLGTLTANYNGGIVEVKATSTGGQTEAKVQYSLAAI